LHKFPYKWYLKDGYPDKNGFKVFGTFINGGGSSMGYKLAGFEHLGGVEIDPQVADIYKTNHKPKYLYVDDIREFNKRDDLPEELYNLDILDGSPPCSTFSMAGSRESAWGKEKVFREGQAKQTLDDLVFVYIETINKLRPKVAILENVKGMIAGNAKAYVKEANRRLNDYGYNVQIFLLNAASMGVPQKRERVFFVCSKKELNYPKLKLSFNEKAIPFREVKSIGEKEGINGQRAELWEKCKQGDNFSTITPNKNFSSMRLSDVKVCNTITANQCEGFFHSTEKRSLVKDELCKIGSYPMDYNFKTIRPMYLVGMSVPPVMIAQIANQIFIQWFSK
jgi:DNA (cytosine-5)-methyltransferase 1